MRKPSPVPRVIESSALAFAEALSRGIATHDGAGSAAGAGPSAQPVDAGSTAAFLGYTAKSRTY